MPARHSTRPAYWTCSGKNCDFRGGPSTMGKHYEQHPDHRSERSQKRREQQERLQLQKRQALVGSDNGGLPTTPTQRGRAPRRGGRALLFCPSCGEKLGEGWLFCGFCGADITS